MSMVTATRQPAQIGARQLELSNLSKELWPGEGITKADLVAYYLAVSARLLPHLSGRPLTFTRYPDGIAGGMFYQKDTPAYAPAWLPTFPVHSEDADRDIRYLLAEEPAALAWLANQAVIEIHPWMSTTAHPDNPDYAVIDLDPAAGATFADAVEIAGLVKLLLDKMRLVGFPKLSGATGVHIYVPLAPRYTYRITSQFVGYLGELVVQAYPAKATNERLVRKRDGKVYVDHLQNLPGKTIVAPYVPRPRPGAPVSAPVAWQELARMQPDSFTLHKVQAVLDRPRDFDAMYSLKQSLDHILPLFRHRL